ncbi:MAG: acyl-CoA thioesterase [Chitinophagales bacterium]|nr:acyl-CoA thioesterase [Chitinophagales bacterium]
MYSWECTWRVRYADTDKMGYLYYGNYPILYEIGRVELMRSLGITYREMEDDFRIMMPVAFVESKYILPAGYDEALTIRTTLNDLPSRIITFNSEIFNENQVLIHKGTVKLVFVNMDNQKTMSCPDFLMQKLKPYFGTKKQ